MRKISLLLVSILYIINTFAQTKVDTQLISIYIQKGDSLVDTLPQQALSFYFKAESLSQKLDNPQKQLQALEKIRGYFVRRTDYEQAIPYYQKSLDLARKIGDKNSELIIVGNLGVLNYFLGNYAKALEYFNNLEKLGIELHDSSALSTAYTNIGSIYNKMDDYKTAEIFFKKSLNIAQELNNLESIATAYNNLGLTEQNRNKDSLAIIYFNKAKEIYHHLWDKDGYITSLLNLGVSYTATGNRDKAFNLYQKALKYAKGYNQRLLAETYDKLGGLYYAKAQDNGNNLYLDSAIFYLESAYNIAEKKSLAEIQKKTSGLLWKIYKEKGQKDKALFYIEKYMEVKDSLYALKKVEIINKIEAKNQLKLQEAQIKQQQKEIEESYIQILRQRKKIKMAAVVLISLLALLISTIILYIKNKREKEKIRLLENKQKILIQNIPGYVATKDTSLKYTYVDEKFAGFLNMSQEIMLGKSDKELGIGEMGCLELDMQVIETGKPIKDLEKKVEHGDHIHWLLVSKIPIFDQNGKVEEILTFFIDITEKKEAELRLIQLKTAVEQSGSIVVMTDINGTITYVNKRFTEVTGYTAEEALGQNPRILNAGMREKRFYEGMWKAILAGRTWRGVFINKKKNGEIFYEKAIIAPIKQDGEIKGFIAIKEDITQERENKLKLVEKTRQFENTINNMQDVYIRTNEKYEIIQVSHSIKDYLELDDVKEIMNKSIFDILDVDSTETRQRIINLIQGRKKLNFTFKYLTKRRKIRFAESRLIALPNKQGIEGIIRDITKRIEWERQLAKINKELNEKNRQIQEYSQSLTDNINYAALIQKAMLPTEEEFCKAFEDIFILYKPMKIVSGDFYYLNRIGNKIIFALGDCTGHGVSGAFISSLAYATLNEILATIKDYQPEMVLENLRNKIKSVFSGSTLSDGLDIALFILDTQTYELKFSGANQVAAVVTNNKFNVVKGDPNPIGRYPKEKPFTCKSFSISKGDKIYMFSDGFIDQFGGKNNNKFYRKNFIKLLEKIHEFDFKEQKLILEQTFEQWKGNNPQTDDVTVIGLKI